MLKLALTIQTPDVEPVLPVALLSGTLEEKLEKAARFGAQGVEMMTVRPKTLDAPAIRAQLKAKGLQAAAVASGGMAFAAGLTLLHADPLRGSQARNRLLQLIEFATQIEAPLVTIGGFRGKLSNVNGNAIELLSQVLYQAAQVAARSGVRLVIEPLNRYETDFISTAQQGLDFLREVSHSNIGLLLDTYHVNIEESSWTAPFQAACEAGKLWHVHLGDNNRLPPGKGLIDFQAILTTLEASGYSGYLSAELLARPNPDQAAIDTIQYIQSLLRS